MGTYEYDLWGNLVSAVQATDSRTGAILDTNNILYRNPFRYRGYYYDAETGFYYLNARYYDSVTHRFINADKIVAGIASDTSGYNLFEYCNSNPINFVDYSGCWAVGIGFNVMLVAGPLVYDFQPMLLLDGELILAVQYANGVGMTPGDTLAGGVGLNFVSSNAPNNTVLLGKGTAEGGSLIIVPGYGVGLYAGLDHNFSGNLDQKIYEGYNGITASVGFSIATNPGAGVHVQVTNTREAWKRNLKDTYKSLVAKIKK